MFVRSFIDLRKQNGKFVLPSFLEMIITHLCNLRVVGSLHKVIKVFLIQVVRIDPCDLTRLNGLLGESL